MTAEVNYAIKKTENCALFAHDQSFFWTTQRQEKCAKFWKCMRSCARKCRINFFRVWEDNVIWDYKNKKKLIVEHGLWLQKVSTAATGQYIF